MVVDLPAPLRPSNAVARPAYAVRSIPRTAATAPNLTHSPLISTRVAPSLASSTRPLFLTIGGTRVRFAKLLGFPGRPGKPGDGRPYFARQPPESPARPFRNVRRGVRRGSGREGLALLGHLDEAVGGGEAVAVCRGQVTGPGDEAGQALAGATVVALHELDGATGQRRVADAHDRADVGGGGGLDDALLEALRGLDRLDEQVAVLEVLDVGWLGVRREQLGQAAPQGAAAAVLVVLVEALAAQSAGTALLEHLRDHGLARVRLVAGRRRVGGRLLDLGHQLHVQLVAELQRADRVAGLGCCPLDRHRVDVLAEHGETLHHHRADDAAGVETAAGRSPPRGVE